MESYESTCISYVRFFAMLSIVLCHFLQALNNNWAWIFNVGVQIFFLVSGYLYGNKEILDWKKYYKKRFVKIYIPFIVFFICVLPLYISRDLFSTKLTIIHILNLQGLFGTYPGITHLWFLTAIMLCYFITPILQKLKKYSTIFLVVGLILVTLNYAVFKKQITRIDWFFLYSVGYFYPNIKPYMKTTFNILVVIAFVFILFNFSWPKLLDYNGVYTRVFHDVLAFLIVFNAITFFKWFKITNIHPFIRQFDKYSFYVYITHHIFILGPFSLVYLTRFLLLNIAIIIAMIILATTLNIYISEKITKKITI